MAMAADKLSSSKARDLHRQLVSGKRREKVRVTRNTRVHMDFSHSRVENEGGNAEGLAEDFETLALAKERTQHRMISAIIEEEEAGLSRDVAEDDDGCVMSPK